MLKQLLRGRLPLVVLLTAVVGLGAAAPAMAQAPGTPDVLAEDDSGFSSTDNYTNDPRPDFTGALNGAASVQVQYATDLVGPWTAYDTPPATDPYDTTGTNNQDPIHHLADGVYYFRAVNLATNEASSLTLVTIDRTAPQTSTPDLDAASDTGPSSTDNITSDPTPTFTGTTLNGEPASTTLHISGPPAAFEGEFSTATYTLTPGAFGPGTYTATAQSIDRAGNVGPVSGALVFEIVLEGCDQGPPTNGTAGQDTMFGTAGGNRLAGLGGNDMILGLGGNDCLVGGAGHDFLDGGSGNDTLDGGTGNDEIEGGAGKDWILGGDGDDMIDAGSGGDRVEAGSGHDEINVRDGEVDTVDCGPGVDTIRRDAFDVVTNCERGGG